jgi:hypothetical protein
MVGVTSPDPSSQSLLERAKKHWLVTGIGALIAVLGAAGYFAGLFKIGADSFVDWHQEHNPRLLQFEQFRQKTKASKAARRYTVTIQNPSSDELIVTHIRYQPIEFDATMTSASTDNSTGAGPLESVHTYDVEPDCPSGGTEPIQPPLRIPPRESGTFVIRVRGLDGPPATNCFIDVRFETSQGPTNRNGDILVEEARD